MSQRLPAVKPKQLIRVLEREGWQLDCVRGSHHVFRHPDQRHRVVVPFHTRDLRLGTLRSILDAAGISSYSAPRNPVAGPNPAPL